MKEMIKDVVQEVLEAEIDDHLGYCKYGVTETKSGTMSIKNAN